MSKPLPTIEDIQENTDFKEYGRAQAVLETLKWLEQGAPERFDGLPGKYEFDMQVFIVHEDSPRKGRPDPACGTACCIAGAIRMFERKGKTYKNNGPHMGIPEHFNAPYGSVLDQLFSCRFSDVYMNEVTPEVAAKTLRRYIKTGIVRWRRRDL